MMMVIAVQALTSFKFQEKNKKLCLNRIQKAVESRELRLVPIVLLATDMVPLELPWDRIIKIINIIIKN